MTKARSRRSSARRPRKRTRRQRVRRWVLIGIGSLAALFFGYVGLLYAFARIPEPNDIARAQSVIVVDRDGKAVGRIHAEADRVSIPFDEMPRHLRGAVLATEDRRFYSHPGISLPSIVRASFANLIGRGIKQGGSTITQQYVKNAFVGSERSVFRKTKEAVLALKLERQRSKDEILELYLNTIYFGRGAYGVEAAAQAYFGKRARDLTVAQSALLAGLIRGPEDYDPSREEEAARGRRDAVLGFMARDGHISREEAERAKEEPVRARKRRSGGVAPHFLEDVRRDLEQRIGPGRLYGGGVTVHSTLDVDWQRAAEDAIAGVYDRARDPEAALVAIDPKTGAVRAMVGARDFGRRQLNLATRARRQPGSTFKPMVLAAGLAGELRPNDSFPAPAEHTFRTDSGPWPVHNYDRRGHGRLTLRRATELSVNTVYARVILEVGPENVVRTAKSLGITSELDAVPALALGTEEVTPIELASAFATLAARGEYREPVSVERVTGKDGRVLFEAPEAQEVRAIDRDVADTVNDVLQGVITSGTGQRAAIGRPAAGKTGTTDDFRDAWFGGYTPDLTTVVWNGYPGGSKQLRGVRGINVVGGSFPAEIWKRFMLEALRNVPASDFPDPRLGEPDDEPDDEDTEDPEPLETETPSRDESEEPSEEPTKSPSPKPTKSKTPSPSPSPTPTASET